MKTLTAVLFAGGESRRMGKDKATLRIDGETLWSRQLRILRELQPDELMVSARSCPSWCPPEIKTVLDEPPSRGPLSGFAATLSTIKTSHALVLAIDLPQMESFYVRRLWKMCGENFGVVPENESAYEPLCAIYPVVATDLVTSAITRQDYSLQNVIRLLVTRSLLRAVQIKPVEQRYFLNLNTPAELSVLKVGSSNCAQSHHVCDLKVLPAKDGRDIGG